MTRTLVCITGVAVVLTACGPQTDPAAADRATSAPATGAAGADSAAAKTAFGAGVIIAVDSRAGTITIDHEPIKEVSWPAMTMSFQASPTVIKEAAVGDRVQFDLSVRGTSGTVTAIYPH